MRYRERLSVPAVWWLLAGLFALSMLLAIGLYLGPLWGIGATLACILVTAGIFVSAAIVVEVDADCLRVGRAVLERRYIGEVQPLDAEQAARRAGVEADARAHLALRPYVKTAVEITLADPDDPVPYWLVSTRRADALAAALARVPSQRGSARPPRSAAGPLDWHEADAVNHGADEGGAAVRDGVGARDRVRVDLVRLDPDLEPPDYAHPGDAGADLRSTEDFELAPGERRVVGTGVAIALPAGYAAFVHPRSGLAARYGVTVVNAPGTVDAGYRGEVKVCLLNTDRAATVRFARGDRIAQLVVQRVSIAEFRTVTDLPDSVRGTGGYGSTGGILNGIGPHSVGVELHERKGTSVPGELG